MKSALSYVEETLVNAEIVKLLPTFLAPTVGSLLSSCLGSHKAFFKSLIPATEQRIEEQRLKRLGHNVPDRVRPLSSTHTRLNTNIPRPTASNGSLTQPPNPPLGPLSASSTS
jgi:hypothetical protein